MSKQKFNAAQRSAIWSAHQKKCAYTERLLDVSNFHIDHIIPESIAKDTAALNSIITEYDLPEDILLFEYCYATHGTLGYSQIPILTRKSADSKFEIIRTLRM